MSRHIAISLMMSGLGLLVACGEDKPAETGQPGAVQCPPGQYYDGRFCQVQGAAPGAPAPTGAPTGTATAPPPGVALPPGAVATTAAGPTAQPLDPAAAAAATQLIAPLSAQYVVAGAKPMGSAIAGNFQQGQSLEVQIQTNPNRCYTIVGVGLPPVANLDISVAGVPLMPGLPALTLGADNTVSPNAIVGGKPDCMKSGPISAMVKVVLTVSQGSGVAAAQVFEK
ncbi:MAG TPA: hypothetical protein VIW29_12200 [Polyangiaceae bacterium]|nr:hypothetical protein [Steroidobacteraceae bacterium]